MTKALIIVAIVAALAYMYFFNDMKYHINFTSHREDQVLHQAGPDENTGSTPPSPGDSGNSAPSSGNQ